MGSRPDLLSGCTRYNLFDPRIDKKVCVAFQPLDLRPDVIYATHTLRMNQFTEHTRHSQMQLPRGFSSKLLIHEQNVSLGFDREL